ncbi:MAG: cyclic nucleotide-binding domain-containing protein [Actinomycetota bacterium]|nr:cyclic nucleotide-binding domain-containing protein [Actinomycetota bacterium]
MSLESLKSSAQLLMDLDEDGLEFLESVATEVVFPAGAIIFEEDQYADTFYLVADGKAGLEVVLATRPPVLLETVGPGEMLGVSWLTYPYRWAWRARAVNRSTLVAFDADAVRARCREDHKLAASVYLTVADESGRRLHAARVRLLDLYPGGRE